jgi:hypothetical protein
MPAQIFVTGISPKRSDAKIVVTPAGGLKPSLGVHREPCFPLKGGFFGDFLGLLIMKNLGLASSS